MLTGCPNAKSDIDAMDAWFKYWKSQGEMKVYSTAYKNVVGNMSTIKDDSSKLETAYDSGDWYTTGDMASAIAKIALPLPASSFGDVTCGNFSLTDQGVADYLAGFIAGITGNDHKAYFETCIKPTAAVEQDICTAVADFETKDNQKVLEGVKKILADVPTIKSWLDACSDAQADIAQLEGWYTYWKGQGEMKVYSTMYKNVVGNMPEIKTDIAALEKDYDAQDCYATGKDAFTIAKIALPLPTAEFLQ